VVTPASLFSPTPEGGVQSSLKHPEKALEE
jgi:hypothetical protein